MNQKAVSQEVGEAFGWYRAAGYGKLRENYFISLYLISQTRWQATNKPIIVLLQSPWTHNQTHTHTQIHMQILMNNSWEELQLGSPSVSPYPAAPSSSLITTKTQTHTCKVKSYCTQMLPHPHTYKQSAHITTYSTVSLHTVGSAVHLTQR